MATSITQDMTRRPSVRPLAAACLALAGLAAAPADAADFPPLTAEERAFASGPGQPNAPAVVLEHRGELFIAEQGPSRLAVRRRVKILAAAGKDFGTVRIVHSGRYRLSRLAGRTVLADGRVVPLPEDAVFKATSSRARRHYTTSVAFPAVEPGAVLDLSYQIEWDGPFFLDPWYFQDRIPVLHSEVVYHVPHALHAQAWQRDPMRAGIKTHWRASGIEAELTASADNLPPVPDEPDGPPFADMAAQHMMIPTAYSTYGIYQRLFESWDSTAAIYDEIYGKVRRRDAGVDDQVGHFARGEPREKAAALYAFVRDEIATGDDEGVGVEEGRGIGRVLAERRGSATEKALLLAAMLERAGIEARLVWAADRARGKADLKIANPDWFDRALVAATVDGRRVFLDAADRTLGFGRLSPGYEGTPAVLLDRKKAEVLTLPEAPFADNLRRARIELAVGADGRAAGRGRLVLGGLAAWERTAREPDAARAAEAWTGWLGEHLPGFVVKDVKVEESVAEARVEVSWEMAESAAADAEELTLSPGRPLGPFATPFPKGARRLSPILFRFARRDETELDITWPAGWTAAVLPRPHRYETTAGAVVVDVSADASARRLTYHHRFELAHRQAANREQVDAVLALCDEAQTDDAEPLVLARR